MRIIFCALFLTVAVEAAGAVSVVQKTYKDLGQSGTLELFIYNPPDHSAADSSPAILLFFGGGWAGGTTDHFSRQASYLASRGMVAICPDYRTKGSHKTPPKTCLEDGKSAMRWVRSHAGELGIDPLRIAAGGGSAGGHIAAAIALCPGFDAPDDDLSVSCLPQALVLFNPVFDNSETGYGYQRVEEYWRAFSPMHNIRESAPPTLVMLGTEDNLIPVATAQEYTQRMEAVGARCDLILYDGQGHGFFNKHRYAETLIATDRFLASLAYLTGEPTIDP